MNRREFVAGLPIAALALGTFVAEDSGTELPQLANPKLRTILGDQRVRSLGAGYRQLHRKEDSVNGLESLILKSIGPGGRDINSALEQAVREDFAKGRTVTLSGWVLSVTEARQCALYSIVAC